MNVEPQIYAFRYRMTDPNTDKVVTGWLETPDRPMRLDEAVSWALNSDLTYKVMWGDEDCLTPCTEMIRAEVARRLAQKYDFDYEVCARHFASHALTEDLDPEDYGVRMSAEMVIAQEEERRFDEAREAAL